MTFLSQEAQTLFPVICRQFSQATGWNLTFAPVEGDFDALETRFANSPDCCWLSEVTDGREPLGLLHLSPSDHLHPACTFVQVTDLADAVSDLLNRLCTATRRLEIRNNDVSTLVHLGMAVPAQDNLAWALTQVLKAAVQLTTARSAAFFLLTPDMTRLKLRAVYQLVAAQVPLAERQLSETGLDLDALAKGPVSVAVEEGESSELLPEGYRVGLCVSVQSETMPIGTLWVYDRRTRTFTDRDRHVLQSIARQIAAVLERVALLRHTETHDRIARELRTASETQPDAAPHSMLSPDARYEIAGRCASCYELGGDLCELIPISPNELAIVVGDASGNSIPAAMIMSAVRGAVRTNPINSGGIPDLMRRMNDALTEITRSHQFMSLCFAVYNAAERTITYSNAGHPPPLLVRRGQTFAFTSHGLLLGVMRDVEYETSVVQLEPEDLVVCFTDGISEARSRSQQMFRSEGIADAVLHCSPGTAEQVLNSVWRRVDAHMAGGELGDDRTLLVLRVR
jgi:sigma-B regulation protein RsbU (phosphoserine phosphatase)